MSAVFYKLTCLTNLHMGSGDVNYDIIDLEVERDPVLGEPTMNASGVKGALRDYCKSNRKPGTSELEHKQKVLHIFGSDTNETDPEERKKGSRQGSYHFFSGDLIARPVRVSEGRCAYVLATTPDLLKHIQRKLAAFGLGKLLEGDIPGVPDGRALSPGGVTEVEGIPVEAGDFPPLTNLLGTDQWVLMTAKQLEEIDLPVFAHNVLDQGISQNLWYEQVVPHESVFGLIINGPDGDKSFAEMLGDTAVVQFGAGATTGNGFTLMEKQEA